MKDAVKDIEEYINLYPYQPEYFYLRGLMNMQREKYPKAIEDFNKCVQLDLPKTLVVKVFLNRGIAYYNNGDYELADADFDQVISNDPKNTGAYHGKGMVKYEMAQYQEAVVEFLKALKLDENNAITHFNLGMSYFRLDETDKACYHFNKSCEFKNRNGCRLFMMECDINVNQK